MLAVKGNIDFIKDSKLGKIFTEIKIFKDKFKVKFWDYSLIF